MKIWIANQSREQIGGGWTFVRSFSQFMHDNLVRTVEECDIVFIPSSSMIDGKQLEDWKNTDKKIVLRVDNIPKDSRNRGAGVSRLRKCADYADLVIYQSMWAKEYAGMITKKDGPVIYNGADTSIFYPPTENKPKFDYKYLFVKDKMFDVAAYHFMQKSKRDPECKLTIVGRFPKELQEYNFDFFNNEKINYVGVVEDPTVLANMMRDHQVLLFPAFADACPQTVVEALNCGMKVELVSDIGGTRELLQLPVEFLSLERMGQEYKNVLEKV